MVSKPLPEAAEASLSLSLCVNMCECVEVPGCVYVNVRGVGAVCSV